MWQKSQLSIYKYTMCKELLHWHWGIMHIGTEEKIKSAEKMKLISESKFLWSIAQDTYFLEQPFETKDKGKEISVSYWIIIIRLWWSRLLGHQNSFQKCDHKEQRNLFFLKNIFCYHTSRVKFCHSTHKVNFRSIFICHKLEIYSSATKQKSTI